MRTFVGIKIKLNSELRLVLDQVQQDLKFESVKWVDLSSLHITLFFLGNTLEEFASELSGFLSDEFSDAKVFEVSICGLGTFGPKGNPKVIWIGLEPNPILDDMQKRVEQFMVANGYRHDERGFNPHITIGRVKGVDNSNLTEEVIDRYAHLMQQKVLVDEIILFKSELTPAGPIYTKYYSYMFCTA